MTDMFKEAEETVFNEKGTQAHISNQINNTFPPQKTAAYLIFAVFPFR